MSKTHFTIDPAKSDEEITLLLLSLRDNITVEEARTKYAAELGLESAVAKLANVNAPITIAKVAPKNLIFGWASVPFTKTGVQLEDHQGHLIDIEDLESAAYNFVVKYRESGDMHTHELAKARSMGELVESMIFTPEKKALLGITNDSIPDGAWWVGFRVPPETHALVRTGQRGMFSIEGSARLEPI